MFYLMYSLKSTEPQTMRRVINWIKTPRVEDDDDTSTTTTITLHDDDTRRAWQDTIVVHVIPHHHPILICTCPYSWSTSCCPHSHSYSKWQQWVRMVSINNFNTKRRSIPSSSCFFSELELTLLESKVPLCRSLPGKAAAEGVGRAACRAWKISCVLGYVKSLLFNHAAVLCLSPLALCLLPFPWNLA